MTDKEIRLSIQLINDAEEAAIANGVRLAEQIEKWAYIGKACIEHPDECYRMLRLKLYI